MKSFRPIYTRKLFAAIFILLRVCGTANVASSAESDSNCGSNNPDADNLSQLQFAKVVGQKGARANIYKDNPFRCATSQIGCKSNAYLLTGDIVALKDMCKQYAYVQYIGQHSITTGWIDSSRLERLKVELPYDDGPSEMQINGDPTPSPLSLTLEKGSGIPVCEAYLQRLNQTVFYRPPYCGRPENDRIPGFSRLHRIPLTPDQTTALYGQMNALLRYGHSHPPIDLDNLDRAHAADGGAAEILAWRYDGGIDINNDGKRLDVVIWAGPPIEDGNRACGSSMDDDPEMTKGGARRAQWAVVATNGLKDIDDAQTRAIWGHPTRGLDLKSQSLDLGNHYQPIGSSMSLFEYHGVTYFDTFFDYSWADFHGKRFGQETLDNYLGVFTRTAGVTRQVCEFHYQDSRWPARTKEQLK